MHSSRITYRPLVNRMPESASGGGVLSPRGVYLVPGGVLSPRRGDVLSPQEGVYLVLGVCLLWGVSAPGGCLLLGGCT